MTLREIAGKLGFKIVHGTYGMEREVKRGYVSDLLSDVIAGANKDDLWITIQVHQNIVAVAVLKEVAGIIIAGNKKPRDDTIEHAKKQDVTILVSDLPAFEIVGRIYDMGIKGA